MDHRLIEGLMEAIAPVIREATTAAIDKATAPLFARIAELEAKTVERGEKGEKGEPGERGEIGPTGERGADAPAPTDEQIAKAVEAYIAEHPPAAGKDGRDGVDGKDAAPGQPGKDGTSVTVEDIAPLVASEVERAVKALPPPKDGRDGRDASDIPMLQRFIADHVVASVGSMFGTITMESPDDGRTLTFGAEFNGQTISHEIKTAIVLDRGVWRQADYVKGDGVTRGGSFWIAQRATDGEPDTADSGWRLSVKRGQNGRDLRPDEQRNAEPIRFR